MSDRAERNTWWTVPLALAPIALLLVLGARLEWSLRGAIAWGVAFVAKLPPMAGLGFVGSRLPAWLYGVLAGSISAAIELGFALLALARAPIVPTLADIFLFAAAAGSIEALAIIGWSLLVPTPNADVTRWLAAAQRSRIVRHQFALERSVAWFGHLGSRSLVALAFVREVPALALVAFITFAVTDGLAAYEHQRQADWFSPATLVRYFRVALAGVVLELVIVTGYLALAGYSPRVLGEVSAGGRQSFDGFDS